MVHKKRILQLLLIVQKYRYYKYISKRRRRRRRIWSYNWLQNRKNKYAGSYNLLEELALEDPSFFKTYLRMDLDTFKKLADLVSPHISKKNTNYRTAIPVKYRLAITLRFLASGYYNNCIIK